LHEIDLKMEPTAYLNKLIRYGKIKNGVKVFYRYQHYHYEKRKINKSVR